MKKDLNFNAARYYELLYKKFEIENKNKKIKLKKINSKIIDFQSKLKIEKQKSNTPIKQLPVPQLNLDFVNILKIVKKIKLQNAELINRSQRAPLTKEKLKLSQNKLVKIEKIDTFFELKQDVSIKKLTNNKQLNLFVAQSDLDLNKNNKSEIKLTDTMQTAASLSSTVSNKVPVESIDSTKSSSLDDNSDLDQTPNQQFQSFKTWYEDQKQQVEFDYHSESGQIYRLHVANDDRDYLEVNIDSRKLNYKTISELRELLRNAGYEKIRFNLSSNYV